MNVESNVENEHQLMQDASHLDKAYKLKEEANARYSEKNYAGAIMLYHRCLLHARAVQQLSQYGLQDLARMERERMNNAEEEMDDENEKSSEADNVVPDLDEKLEKVGERRTRMSSTSRGEEMKSEAIDITLKCYNNLAACILNGPNRTQKDYLRAVEYCDKVLACDANNEKALYRKGSALAKANLHEKAIAVLRQLRNNREANAIVAKCEQALHEERRRRDDQIRRNFARASARENARANAHAHDGGGEGLVQNAASTMNGTANATLFGEL